MSADQPLTGDELATIKARADDFPRYGLTGSDRQLIDEDVPRLVAEVERLQAALDDEYAHRDEEQAARNERP